MSSETCLLKNDQQNFIPRLRTRDQRHTTDLSVRESVYLHKSRKSFRLIIYRSRPLKSRRTVMKLTTHAGNMTPCEKGGLSHRNEGSKFQIYWYALVPSQEHTMLKCNKDAIGRSYKSRPKTHGILSQEQNDLAPFIPLHPQAPPEFLLLLCPAQSNARSIAFTVIPLQCLVHAQPPLAFWSLIYKTQ